MSVLLNLEHMSTDEKLAVLEALWADLRESAPARIPAPLWHKNELSARQREVDAGTATLSDWPAAKQRIRNRAR